MRKTEERSVRRQGTAYPGEERPGVPLDPAYVIGWHVGKAAADREAREFEQAVAEVWRAAA